MAKLTFETDLCKGCGLCLDACPKNILRLGALRKALKLVNGYSLAMLAITP